MMQLLFILLLTFSLPSWALQETSKVPEMEIGSMLASLFLVLAIIFIFAFLVKKINLFSGAKSRGQISVIATQALHNKGRVQVIEVQGKQYLLGVTEQNITLIDKLEQPFTEQTAESQAEKGKFQQQLPGNPFAKVLDKISDSK